MAVLKLANKPISSKKGEVSMIRILTEVLWYLFSEFNKFNFIITYLDSTTDKQLDNLSKFFYRV